MIAFITTVRHPHNSNDYRRVGWLLTRTLRSVLAQTDPNLVVVVVCNRRPDVDLADNRVTFVEVGFPAPSTESGPEFDFNAFRRDKGTKCAIGLTVARSMNARHVMFFDADDLISNRLAARVNSQPDHPGWFLASGYIYSDGTRYVQLIPNGFQQKNGSTSIIRTDLIELPPVVTEESTQDLIIDAAGSVLIDVLLGMHGYWHDHLMEAGYTMEQLSDPLAVWVIGTGENHSGNLVSARTRQLITPELSAEFRLVCPGRVAGAAAMTKLRLEQARRRLSHRSSSSPVSAS